MGLFDRKRPEAEEDIAPQPVPAQRVAPAKQAAPAQKAAEPAKQAAPSKKAVEPAKPAYGIQNAIELMRQLPSDNVALVVEVVKKTLESLHVDIGSIIADAERKRARIDDRVVNLQTEIDDFEEEIAARKDEIEALTADRDETKTVKERLELALQPANAAAARRTPAASVPPPGGVAAQAGVIGAPRGSTS